MLVARTTCTLFAFALIVFSWKVAEAQRREPLTDEEKGAMKTILRPGVGIYPFSSDGPYLEADEDNRYTPLTDEEVESLSRLPELQMLRIESPRLLNEWLGHAERIPGLRSLEISLSPSAKLSPEQLDAILRLEQLEGLELWFCQVSDSDLKKLTALKNLRQLRLGLVRLTSRAFASIAEFPELRFLLVSGNLDPESPVGSHGLPPDWESLAKLQHLEEVHLANTGLFPADIPGIERLQSLRVLHLSVSKFSDVVRDALVRIPNLEHLELRCFEIVGQGLAGLRDAKRLKTFRVSCIKELSRDDLLFTLEYAAPSQRTIAVDVDLPLGQLAEVLPGAVRSLSVETKSWGRPYRVSIRTDQRALSVNRDRITSQEMAALGRIRQLKGLSIKSGGSAGDSRMTIQEGLRHLQRLPELERVTLDLGGRLEVETLQVLGSLPALKWLELHDVALGADGLRWLGGLSELHALTIDGGRISGDALAVLEKLESPISLTFRNVALTAPRLQYLADAPIDSLDLVECKVTDSDCSHLGQCDTLRRLTVDGGAVSDRGLAHLAPLHHLEALRIKTSGMITVDGFRQIGSLRRLRFVDAVGQGDVRLTDGRLASEFGWTFQGECSCGCMDVAAPRVYRVTTEQIENGRGLIDPEAPDLRHRTFSGLRFRGPMDLERLELRAGDFPFTIREIHLNDCRINELVLDGIELQKVSCWGDSRIGRKIQRKPLPAAEPGDGIAGPSVTPDGS